MNHHLISRCKSLFLLILVLQVLLLLSGCEVTETPQPTEQELSAKDFDFLKKGLSLNDIIAKVGEPNEDIGSGLYIYIYNLADGRQVQLSFANLDHLIAAGIYDPKTKENLELVK